MVSNIHFESPTYFDLLDFETKQKLEDLFLNVSDELSRDEGFCRELIKVDDFFKGRSVGQLPVSSDIKARVRKYLIEAFNREGKLSIFHLSEANASIICATTLTHIVNEKFKSLTSINPAPVLRAGFEILEPLEAQRGAQRSRNVQRLKNSSYKLIAKYLLLGELRGWLRQIDKLNSEKMRPTNNPMDFILEEDRVILLLIDEFAEARIAINRYAFLDIQSLLQEIEEHGGNLRGLLPRLRILTEEWGQITRINQDL